jgi:hypothetical protein
MPTPNPPLPPFEKGGVGGIFGSSWAGLRLYYPERYLSSLLNFRVQVTRLSSSSLIFSRVFGSVTRPF